MGDERVTCELGKCTAHGSFHCRSARVIRAARSSTSAPSALAAFIRAALRTSVSFRCARLSTFRCGHSAQTITALGAACRSARSVLDTELASHRLVASSTMTSVRGLTRDDAQSAKCPTSTALLYESRARTGMLAGRQSTTRRAQPIDGSHLRDGSSAPHPAAGDVPSRTRESCEEAAATRHRSDGVFLTIHRCSSSSASASASASMRGR